MLEEWVYGKPVNNQNLPGPVLPVYGSVFVRLVLVQHDHAMGDTMDLGYIQGPGLDIRENGFRIGIDPVPVKHGFAVHVCRTPAQKKHHIQEISIAGQNNRHTTTGISC